jgi:hypothetical protein
MKKYYFYHAESDSLWSSDSPDYENPDGCVEPISEKAAFKIAKEHGLEIPHESNNQTKKQNMKIVKSDFQEALEIVKPGLSSKELVEQSTSFAFMGDRVVTYNDEISISHPVKDLDINGAVKADELYKLLPKLKEDEFELEVSENEVIIKSGKITAGIAFEAEIKLPIDDIGELGKFKKIPEDLLDAMKFAAPNASTDMSRPILTAIHVSENGYVESSDSFRIARHNIGTLPIKTFLLPATSVSHVCRINPNKISEGNGWVHFKNGQGTIISCRILSDDEFVDVNPYLKVKGNQVEWPAKTLEILERAVIFGGGFVSIYIEGKKMRIESKSATGWFKEVTNIRHDGDDFSFMISSEMLRGILQKTLTSVISDRLLKFEDEKWIYVTLLNVIQ